MKIINSQFTIHNSRIISLFFVFIVGLGMVFTVNAQGTESAAPVQSDVRVTAPEQQSDVRVTAPQADVRVTAPKNSNIFTLQNPLKVNSLGELIQSFVQIFTYLVILFAVLMFIYIGFKYVTNAAQGNASEITKLHSQLMWLIVGVAVVIGARVLIQVVINTLSATGVVDQSVIQSANNAIGGK